MNAFAKDPAVLGTKVSNYARVKHEWYVEPPSIVEKLLEVEDFPGLCWDPACGGGNIPAVLRGRGARCLASDKVDRGCPDSTVEDFLLSERRADHIVCNPPFAIVEDWVRQALRLTAPKNGKVALLLRLGFLEGVCRDDLFASTPLARVWVSRSRVNIPPGGMGVKPGGTKIPIAWFVWDKRHRGGLPTVGRI